MSNRPPGRPSAADPEPISTDALLDAALEAFADRGYDGMSVRELARSLDVSHNFIPQRVGSKNDLWYAAVDRAFGVLAIALAETLVSGDTADDAESAAYVERLRALVVRFIEANARRPALVRIISQEAANPGPRLDHIFENYIEPVRQFGEDVLETLAARGEVNQVSVPLFYFLLTHGAGGSLALPALAQRLGATVDAADPDAVRRHAEEAANWIFDGLLARPNQS